MKLLRGMRNDQLSGLALVALALFLWWENRAYPLGTLEEPGPGYTPLLIAIFLGAIGLLIALRGMHSPRIAEMAWPEARRATVILLACAAATYALEEIGYRLTVAALLVFFLGVLERKPPLTVAVVSVSFALLSFYLIGDVLHVPLPRGPGGW